MQIPEWLLAILALATVAIWVVGERRRRRVERRRFVRGYRFPDSVDRRLAVIEPDWSHIGPDAYTVTRDAFRKRVGTGSAALKARIMREGNDVTLVSYSIGVGVALDAAAKLAEDGIEAEVIDLRTLRPLDKATVLKSLAKTNRLMVAEQTTRGTSIGALVMITGLPRLVSRSRKKAVSSSVSVPWVTTTPCSSGRSPKSWFTRRASATHCAVVTLPEATLLNCSTLVLSKNSWSRSAPFACGRSRKIWPSLAAPPEGECVRLHS